jgi:hypothetical protein
MLECLLRRPYESASLLRDHPPKLKHAHKRLALELASAAPHRGTIELTRWRAATLPARCELAPTDVVPVASVYEYSGEDGVWHVNFADPQLFVAYGSALLAQDELQVLEHPALGSLREALLAEKLPALTEEGGAPTPVLVAGVERRIAIATDRDLDAGRPYGLYGNQFARAEEAVVRRAIRVIDPPTLSNLIAIAAPGGGRGPYFRAQLEGILVTAFTGFAAARHESRRRWPDVAVEIRTGFWGCGAFGGNRHAMTLLQLLAARLAGIDRVRFYTFDERGRADFETGARDLARVVGDEPLADVLERIADLDYQWGESDGT